MKMRSVMSRLSLAAVAVALLATVAATAADAPDYAAVVAAPDRSAADRETDKRRDPTELLAFTGARPGMKVLDMGAAAGYSTELLARTVAPGGMVYAQDDAAIAERVKDKYDERAKSPAMKNVVRTVRPYDDPLPADVHDIDLVTFFFWYHDTRSLPR
jgi:predicted methyltransferase